MNSYERRREPRIQAHRPIRIILPDGSRLDAKTADLSPGGLAVRCAHRLPAGIHLTLEISVDSSGTPLTLDSNVQHCSGAKGDSGFNLGLRHTNPPTAYLGLLRSVRMSRWHLTPP